MSKVEEGDDLNDEDEIAVITNKKPVVKEFDGKQSMMLLVLFWSFNCLKKKFFKFLNLF